MKRERIEFCGDLATSYPRARSLSTSVMRNWAETVRRHVPPGAAPVLDLGSGTGRFSGMLAVALDVRVIAVEPSADMRQEHRATASAAVWQIGGRAERIPCADATVRAIWASQIIHHVVDTDACGREMHRVLRPEGRILVRGGFNDDVRPPRFHQFFPELSKFSEEASAALAALESVLADHGIARLAHDVVEQLTARSLAELHDQARLRGRSPLRRLSDDEFMRGIERLRLAKRNERHPRRIHDFVDLLVFGPLDDASEK